MGFSSTLGFAADEDALRHDWFIGVGCRLKSNFLREVENDKSLFLFIESARGSRKRGIEANEAIAIGIRK